MTQLVLAPTDGKRPASTLTHGLFVALALVPPLIAAWVLWIAPIDGLTADRTALAARDFTALWSAGRLAAEHATAILADPASFTARLRDWFGPGMPDQIWPYPPTMLLVAAPLAQWPLACSFLLYTTATLLLLYGVLRLARLPPALCALSLLSPAVADNVLIGQNGALTAALLVGGLMLVETRPHLAGALLGALILKPQLGLLIPVCLLGGQHWRCALAAGACAASLALLSWACFGNSAWLDYLLTARPAITAYFEAPWQQPGTQHLFTGAFTAARSLGADLTASYAVQAAATLACAIATWVEWRRPQRDRAGRMAITVALTCAASPWIHSYDMPALAVAILTLALARRSEQRPWLAFAWCWPGALTLLAIPNSLLWLSTLSIVSIAWRSARPSNQTRSMSDLRCA